MTFGVQSWAVDHVSLRQSYLCPADGQSATLFVECELPLFPHSPNWWVVSEGHWWQASTFLTSLPVNCSTREGGQQTLQWGLGTL